MIQNNEKVHFCLNCSSAFSENDFEILKLKNYLFTLGLRDVKCPNCKSRGQFVTVTTTWADILSTLNSKGYKVVDCSIVDVVGDKLQTSITFDKPIKLSIMPKSMSYAASWSTNDDNVLLRSNENKCVLLHQYYDKSIASLEFEKLSINLLKWAKKIPLQI